MVAAGVVWIAVDTLPGSSPWSGGSLIVGGLAVLSTIVVSLWQARQAREAGRPTPAELLAMSDEERHRAPAGTNEESRS
jgi:hypothetical protein